MHLNDVVTAWNIALPNSMGVMRLDMELCMQGDVWRDSLDNGHFNAGVLSLEPNMAHFVEMIAAYRNYTVYEDEGQAEQANFGCHLHSGLTFFQHCTECNLRMQSAYFTIHWVACMLLCSCCCCAAMIRQVVKYVYVLKVLGSMPKRLTIPCCGWIRLTTERVSLKF